MSTLFLVCVGVVLAVVVCFAIGFLVAIGLMLPGIEARDEALSLAIELVDTGPDPIFGVPRVKAVRFEELVRKIPEMWAPPSVIVIQR